MSKEPKEFVQLREEYGKRRGQKLYEDNFFDDDPLFTSSNVILKRPQEICRNPPQFITNGIDRFDVKQGELGDCWLLAAVASLTLNKSALDKVVPQHQTFEKGYFGAFYFRLYSSVDNEWKVIIVDDRLPCKRLDGRFKLVFMHSQDSNEFWSALLEKACAKLYGGYKKLDGGIPGDAIKNFTGDRVQYFDLINSNDCDKMFSWLRKCHGVKSERQLCIVITGKQAFSGLVGGHAYSVNGFETVWLKYKNVHLLSVRNPWGECEWDGYWSDRSHMWEQLDKGTKERLLKQKEDGEFWMSWEDFQKCFTFCYVQVHDAETKYTHSGKRQPQGETKTPHIALDMPSDEPKQIKPPTCKDCAVSVLCLLLCCIGCIYILNCLYDISLLTL